jgi:ribose 1,5-bisphosphokinase PhnN
LLREMDNTALEFPVRYVTRAPRPDDDPVENVAISKPEFERLQKAGGIAVAWPRELRGVGQFWYGVPGATKAGAICVISGNNAFARNVHLPGALVLEIWASEETRKKRLHQRSGQLSAAELSARVTAHDALGLEDVDMRIVNEDDGLVGLKAALREVVASL